MTMKFPCSTPRLLFRFLPEGNGHEARSGYDLPAALEAPSVSVRRHSKQYVPFRSRGRFTSNRFLTGSAHTPENILGYQCSIFQT